MRGFATLVLAFLLSGIVAGAVQVQLGILFRANQELMIAMMMLVAMTLVTTVVLGLALVGSKTVSGVNRTAGVLFAVTMAMIFSLAAFVSFTRAPISHVDIEILVEIVVPLAVMIVIQWWVVRRHWVKRAAAAATPIGGAS